MEKSYFPNEPWRKLSDRYSITTGSVYYHDVNSKGSVESCPCVFLRDQHGMTPVYKGCHPHDVLDNITRYVELLDLDRVNLFSLLKKVDWHRDPEHIYP